MRAPSSPNHDILWRGLLEKQSILFSTTKLIVSMYVRDSNGLETGQELEAQ